MDNTSYVALSRQTTLWNQLEVVANNLANVNTTAYRGKEMMFTEYLSKTLNDDSVFREQVNFVQDYGMAENLTPGALQDTGNPMDLALEGNGYFVVEGAQGQMYTRAGRFMLDVDGKVVNSSGQALLTRDGNPIFIAPNESEFTVARDGTVSTENGVLGRLQVVSFDDQQALVNVGDNMYDSLPDQTANPVENPMVVQGMIEQSNVNGVVEITKLIDLQRSYGHANQMIEAENQRISKTVQVWAKEV
jgi:flagellar basal-body rod protein FlgF